jgi:hypothetical protein
MWKWIAIGVVTLTVSTSTAFSQDAADARQPQVLTFDGDVVLWTVAIKPDKTADFEQVMARLHQALAKSQKPERRAQAAGWKVLRISKPMPDGNIAYVHVISPVVPNADYTVMQILYDELPDERQTLYELYRSAFANNLALAVGDVAVDMSQTLGAPVQTAAAVP